MLHREKRKKNDEKNGKKTKHGKRRREEKRDEKLMFACVFVQTLYLITDTERNFKMHTSADADTHSTD